MSGSPGGSNDQEFVVRIPPRNSSKKYHIMKFNASLNIDTSKWTQVRMIRENNRREFVREEDDVPEFGAGSEFGRKEKEEARRKKFGINTKRYNPDNQPWLMRIGGKKDGKQYKGVREGGVTENTAYYVFTHAADGSFEAHPVKEWYNFTPRVTYRTLNAEEAEEKFAERGKILNHFALMVNRKLKPNQEEADGDLDDEGGSKKGKGGSGKDGHLKVSDMDDWVDSEDELDSDEDGDDKKKKKKDSDDDGDGGGKKNSRSKDSKKKNKKKNKDEVDDEAFEDSDDGDEEGLEVDYMSDESSDSEEELIAGADIKGVDQDKALARMLDSESSSESENEEKKEEEEEKKEDEENGKEGGKKGKKKKDGAGGKSSTKSSANNSRSTTPTPSGGEPGDKSEGGQANDEKVARAEKRKALVDNLLDPNADTPAAKKARPDPFSSSSSSVPPPPPANSTEAMFEEYARRYLARKPMTTTELLKKFKSKKTDLPNEELMPILVNVLKRINPHKQKIKGTMYLSLKSEK